MDKKQIRTIKLIERKNLSIENKKQLDACLKTKVLEHIKPYHKIGIFISMKDEIDTYSIIQECLKDKEVYAPVCVDSTLEFYRVFNLDDLVSAPFNLKEPPRTNKIDIEDIDIMLTPLLAYDSSNNRVGYGKGYYDSVLMRCKYTVGLAYHFQYVDKIDVESHDVALDRIIVC